MLVLAGSIMPASLLCVVLCFVSTAAFMNFLFIYIMRTVAGDICVFRITVRCLVATAIRTIYVGIYVATSTHGMCAYICIRMYTYACIDVCARAAQRIRSMRS